MIALPSRANTMKNWNRLPVTSCSRFIPSACCMIRSVKSVSVWSMKGASSSIAMKTTMIFGTKVKVTSWIWVSAWNSEMTRPISSAMIMSGAPSFSVTMTASRPTSRRTASSMHDYPAPVALRWAYARFLDTPRSRDR